MHITFSNSAIEQLSPYLNNTSKQLKLLYDTEGCGCALSGVPALQLIEEPDERDRLTQGDPFSFWYEPRHEVFFEPKLRVDYDASRNSFILNSDNQIYTTHLRLLTAVPG